MKKDEGRMNERRTTDSTAVPAESCALPTENSTAMNDQEPESLPAAQPASGRPRLSPILQNHHVLAVHDARRSARFFVEMLGFQIVDEPPGWVFVARENCMFMLGECPDDMAPGEMGCHNYVAYLRVAEADSYFASLKASGADLLSEIEDKPWGMREFGLRTIDGHRITIGHCLPNPQQTHR
jgi:catechol 2,3-dioxygenase-like lactoylglutathione lyase family enzyme